MNRKQLQRLFYKSIIISFVFIQCSYIFLFKTVNIGRTASLTNASVTLSNSRLSYKAGITTAAASDNAFLIDGSGNADNDTNHLFPNDTICVANDVESGCRGATASTSVTYTVANIVDATHFNVSSPVTQAASASDFVVATQSGTMTLTFATTYSVPVGGDILITIPAVNTTGKTSDGIPDTSSSLATNGFDLGIGGTAPATLGTADISVDSSSCTGANWTVANVTVGTSSTDHTIRLDRSTTSCAGGSTILLTIGTASRGVINPAPINTGHTQGNADIYTINVRTRDGSDNILEQVDMKVAPVEGVLVSATVDETLTFTVAGVASGTSTCGQTTDITTFAYAVPWGTLSTANTFSEGTQQLTVSTNAPSGYSVKVEENDQMGKNGNVCATATAGEANNCIKDTTCDGGSCTQAVSADWAVATNNGFGFSLANQTGTDAAFSYNEAGRSFSTRQVADQEVPETKATIMTNAAPVSGKSIYVCYRISVSATQPAGYYFNKVKYTATAIF